MKQKSISSKRPADFPRTRAQKAAAVARAPKTVPYDPANDPYDPNDETAVEAFWKDAIISHSWPELHAKLAERRTRGPGKKPAKVSTTLRLPPDVLARWRKSGAGWQTRMAEVLEKRAP